MSDLKPPSGLWSEPGSRLQFWADLQPGMLLEIKPAQFGRLGVYRVDAWGNVHADGAQSIVAPKVVLLVRANVMNSDRLYLDLILGDSIWRLFDQEGLSMTIVSLKSSPLPPPLSGNPPFQDILPCNPLENQVELGCEEEKATAS